MLYVVLQCQFENASGKVIVILQCQFENASGKVIAVLFLYELAYMTCSSTYNILVPLPLALAVPLTSLPLPCMH